MNTILKSMISNKFRLSLFLLGAIYLVGFVTVFAGYQDELMQLTSFNLLFAVILLIYNAEKPDFSYRLWFIAAGMIGFAMEAIGTSTGMIFGEYSYGETLGVKLFQVPLMIGVNWSFLVFSTAALVHGFSLPAWLKAAMAASIMVVYDLLLEPVAIRFDFWHWAGGSIPLQNYLAWWIIAFVLLLGCFYLVKPLRNRIAPWILGVQVLFFVVLLLS